MDELKHREVKYPPGLLEPGFNSRKCALNHYTMSVPTPPGPLDGAGKSCLPWSRVPLRERGLHVPRPPEQEQPEEKNIETGPSVERAAFPWFGVANICEFPMGHWVRSKKEAILPAPHPRGSPPGRRPQQQALWLDHWDRS